MIDKQALQAGIAALGLSVDSVSVDQLVEFSRLVAKWNKTHNLTSINSPDEFLSKHILDSLSLLPLLNHHFADREYSLLDIGSGAGFPGIVLAIASNNVHLTSIDASQKRVAFQNQVIRQLGLTQVEAKHSRIEQISGGNFQVITSRAFSSLTQIVTVSRQLLADDGCWLLMKGAYPVSEIEAFSSSPLSDVYQITEVKPIDVPQLDAARHLVAISCR